MRGRITWSTPPEGGTEVAVEVTVRPVGPVTDAAGGSPNESSGGVVSTAAPVDQIVVRP